MFDCVLFDLDGTLIDSAPDLAAAANRLRQEKRLPDLPLDAYRHMTGAGARGMIGVALGVMPDHPDFSSLKARFFDYYEADLTSRTQVFDGIESVLAKLEAAKTPWGIVTNKMARFAEPICRQITALGNARVLVCGDTTPHSKPHPEPLLTAARKLGVAPESCLYVGDDLRDVEAATAAGMRSAVAAYGYLGEAGDPRQWGADFLLDKPFDLLNLQNTA